MRLFAFLLILLHFERNNNVDFDDVLFFSLPSIIIEFAYGSRIDSGYRLLERALRHSFDNKIGNFKNAGLKIVRKKAGGDLGFLITYDVPASMKKNVYHVEVLVTGNDLCMSKCNCQAGGQGVERIICVHTLVLPYLLTLMLTSGCLAEHILIELSNRWEVEWDTLLDDGKLRHMKEKILCLIEATGN